MSQEIIYTSAPQGLKVGSRGFCTVASTSGMAKPLADYLESLSGYRHVFSPGDPNARLNPVCNSHLIIKVAGQRYHVLSRIADAGLDYSQRTNKLAHHVALSTTELVEAGPAWVLSQPGFMESAWSGEPRLLPAGRRPPQGNASPAVCHAWKQLTGDAGWGGVLAETIAASATGEAYLIYRPGMELLPLLLESQLLLPTQMRWQATFSSYHTKLPPGAQCRWKCVLADSAEAIAAQRARSSQVLDLTAPLGAAPNSAWPEAARHGTTPKQAIAPSPQGSPVGQTLDLVPDSALQATRPSINTPLELAATPPSLRNAMGAQGQGSEEDLFGLSFRPARPRGANAFGATPKKKWPKVVVLLVLLLALAGVGVAGGMWWRKQQNEQLVATSELAPANATSKKKEEVIPKPPPEEETANKDEIDKEKETEAQSPPAETDEPEKKSDDTPESKTLSDEDPSKDGAKTSASKLPKVEPPADVVKDQPKPKAIRLDKVPPYVELGKERSLELISAIFPQNVKELRLLGDKYELQQSTDKNQKEWNVVKRRTTVASGLGGDAPVAWMKFKDNSLHFEWQGKGNDATEPHLKYHVLQLTTSDQQVKYIPFSDQKYESLHVVVTNDLSINCKFPLCESYLISHLRVTDHQGKPFTDFTNVSQDVPFQIRYDPEKRIRISVKLIDPKSGIDGRLEPEVTVQNNKQEFQDFPKLNRLNDLETQKQYNTIKNNIKRLRTDLKNTTDSIQKDKLEGEIIKEKSELENFKKSFFTDFHKIWPDIEDLENFRKLLEHVRLHFVVLGRIKASDESDEFIEFPILVVGDRPENLVKPHVK